MRSTVVPVGEIPPLEHEEAMVLAQVEYDRLLGAAAQLGPDDWARPTRCTGWDVKDLLGHVLGMMECDVDPGEQARQVAAAIARLQERGGYRIDALTGIQVDEHAHLTPPELLEALRATAPRSLAGRTAMTAEERPAPYRPGPPFDGEWTRGYLNDVIRTRDVWMHRVDIADATGRDVSLTPEHDGRLVADVVGEWARRHGRPFTLVLAGPAGGAFVSGEGGERYELDAVEFCRLLSGRGAAWGLLTTEVPF